MRLPAPLARVALAPVLALRAPCAACDGGAANGDGGPPLDASRVSDGGGRASDGESPGSDGGPVAADGGPAACAVVDDDLPAFARTPAIARDLSLAPSSPARGVGVAVPGVDGTFDHRCLSSPPNLGAY